jgi:hypothetical protein
VLSLIYGYQLGQITRLDADKQLYRGQLEALMDNATTRGFEVSVDKDYACLRPPNERVPYCASVNERITPIEG